MRQTKHANSKIVRLKRVIPLNMDPKDPEVLRWMGTHKVSLGSYFNGSGRGNATGLSPQEVEVLLPRVINVLPTDMSFKSEVSKYYGSITTRIPAEGQPLEIGLSFDNDKEVTFLAKVEGKESLQYVNLPLNIDDYLTYRHAIGHPHCRESEEEAISDPTAQCYIDDPYDSAERRNKALNDIDNAMASYLTVKQDVKKVNMVLQLLGKKVSDIPKEDRVSTLKALLDENPKKFKRVATDPQLAAKYEITQMVSNNILIANGNAPRYVIAESGSEIAVGIEELLGWMKDKANTEDVGLLKSKLQAALKDNK